MSISEPGYILKLPLTVSVLQAVFGWQLLCFADFGTAVIYLPPFLQL